MTRFQFNSVSTRALFAADDAAAASTAPAAVKVKTVAEDMDSRRLFDTPEEAAAYLNLCATEFSDFIKQPMALVGMTPNAETGGMDFDPEVYIPGKVQIMVSTLRKTSATGKDGAKERGIKAIVVSPKPTLAYLMEDEAGTEWVDRIIAKELAHVAVRPIRDVEDISTAVDQMPKTKTNYISSARESAGMIEAFNTLYKRINESLGSKVPMWKKAKLVKNEMRKAMESAGYAQENYPALEMATDKRPGLFVLAIQLGASTAKKEGLDASIFERWLATRDQKVAATPDEDEDDLDLSDLEDAMKAEPTPAPAADSTEAAPAQ